jgi:hypothetical protein
LLRSLGYQIQRLSYKGGSKQCCPSGDIPLTLETLFKVIFCPTRCDSYYRRAEANALRMRPGHKSDRRLYVEIIELLAAFESVNVQRGSS